MLKRRPATLEIFSKPWVFGIVVFDVVDRLFAFAVVELRFWKILQFGNLASAAKTGKT